MWLEMLFGWWVVTFAGMGIGRGFLLEKKNVRPKKSNGPLKLECNGFTPS